MGRICIGKCKYTRKHGFDTSFSHSNCAWVEYCVLHHKTRESSSWALSEFITSQDWYFIVVCIMSKTATKGALLASYNRRQQCDTPAIFWKCDLRTLWWNRRFTRSFQNLSLQIMYFRRASVVFVVSRKTQHDPSGDAQMCENLQQMQLDIRRWKYFCSDPFEQDFFKVIDWRCDSTVQLQLRGLPFDFWEAPIARGRTGSYRSLPRFEFWKEYWRLDATLVKIFGGISSFPTSQSNFIENS